MFSELIKKAKELPLRKVAIACPEHEEILDTIVQASSINLCHFVLFGDESKISSICQMNNIDLPKNVKIVNTASPKESCVEAVKYVKINHDSILMKGYIDTSIILKEVINSEYGLRTDSILSHVMVCKLPKFNRLLFLTDGAMNISPSFNDLIHIVNNAIGLAKDLKVDKPKVAILSAIEKVNPKMPSTVLANEVCEHFRSCDNFYIKGPLALDGALDKHAAKIKNLDDPVSGNANILVGTYIEVINTLYKSWAFGFDGMESGGIILGAKAPIVLVSRSDMIKTKINSLALAILNSAKENI